MALPKRIELAGRRWRIVEGDLTAHEAVGLCDSTTATITVAPGQEAWELRDTLLHELLHAILRSQGRPYDEGPEELYVGALAPGLLGALRTNPGLARYLFTEKL
jgi:hypothetical protein